MLFDFSITGTPLPRTDRHRLAGTVKIDGVPGPRLVVVMDRVTLALLASTWSLSDGSWEISGIPEYPEQRLLVLSLDHTGNYNAGAADYVSQVTA